MATSKRICIGAIKGPHGVCGQVRIASFTEEPEDIFAYAPITDEGADKTFALTFRGMGKDHYIASIAGVTTREQAEALKGVKLFIAREDLPAAQEGSYYYADLEGLEARDGAGTVLGHITAMHDYGAGAFLEVQPLKGKSFMLPFKDAFVPQVDIAGGFVTALIPEGWLGEDKPPKAKKPDKDA